VVATGRTGVVALAVDTTTLYFADGSGVHFVPIAGGTVKDLADASGKPLRLAVDAANVYWSENLGGAVMRAPKDGSGSPAVVVAATQPQGLVVVGNTVYWVSNADADQSIHAVPASGGMATTFATVGPYLFGLSEIVTDGSNLYVAIQTAAYQIPILAGGVAGTPSSLSTPFHNPVAGPMAARGNDYCTLVGGLSYQGVLCEKGGWVDELIGQDGLSFGPFVLPTCGLVYSETGAAPTLVTYLVADRDFYSDNVSTLLTRTLYSNNMATSGPLITDGSWIYFFESTGNIRRLPLP
jgi:hypothetical protein